MSDVSSLLWVTLLMGVLGVVLAWRPPRLPHFHLHFHLAAPHWLLALRAEHPHARELLAGPARDIGPSVRLMGNGLAWLLAAWAKRDLWRKDPLHPDIPGLVIRERELRP